MKLLIIICAISIIFSITTEKPFAILIASFSFTLMVVFVVLEDLKNNK